MHKRDGRVRDGDAEFEEELKALMDLSGTWVDLVQDCVPLDKLILDLYSSQRISAATRSRCLTRLI